MPRKKRASQAKVSLFVDEELYRRLKAYSAYAGLSMTDMLNALIEEGVPDLRTVDVAAPESETRAA